VFSTQVTLLEVARKAEETADKNACTRRRKRLAAVEIEEQENELFENASSNSESDCIVVEQRR
jgi:hypothetical protein